MNHLDLLKSGIESWNQWRLSTKDSRDIPCDLSGHNLSQGYFFEGDFSGVNFKGANLKRACFIGADLSGADLTNADLSGAYLGDANLYGANLSNANFTKANLDRTNLQAANLFGTAFTDADIRTTQLPAAETSLSTDVAFYTDVALTLLIKGQRADDNDVTDLAQNAYETVLVERPAKRPVERIAKSATKTAATTALRQSLLSQMRVHLASLTPETPSSARTRQEAIRQSATPFLAKRVPAQLTQSAQLAQSTQSQSGQRNWGRRRADQQLSARLRRQFGQRKVWMPAAAVTLLMVGLPLGFINERSQGVVAQSQPAEPLALIKSLTGASQVWAVAAQPEKNGASWVIGGSANGQIDIWDGQTGELLRTMSGHNSGVRSLAISSSGQWLVSGSHDSLKVWQLNTGQLAYSRQHDSNLDSVTVRQWDIASSQLLKDFIGREDDLRTVALNPDGTMLVSNSSEPLSP